MSGRRPAPNRIEKIVAFQLQKLFLKHRERLGWTQEELAKKTGISIRRIRTFERGRGFEVNTSEWFAFCTAVDIPLDSIFAID